MDPWDLDWDGVKVEEAQASSGGGGGTKPTPQDMMALNAASSKAQVERDALREYANAARDVDTFDTGPWRAAFYDAITPEQDGGFLDKVGGAVGAVLSPFISTKTLDARSNLNRLNAVGAISGASDMKGAASDRDIALQRLKGVSPYNTRSANHTIIKKATYDSYIAQLRARVLSSWITKYGSTSRSAPNGMTYEQALKLGEDHIRAEMTGQKPQGRALPKPPPRSGGGAKRQTYDINGNSQ